MRAKKAPMCSVRLLAIKLKGLAAPGEALKNNYEACLIEHNGKSLNNVP